MATPLESSFLASMAVPAVVFILIFSTVYALLKMNKIFGKSQGLISIISFAVAFLAVITPGTNTVVANFIPWVFLLFALVLFIFVFFIFLGVKKETMIDVAKDSTFVTFAIIIIIGLFLVALGKAFGPFLLVTGKAGFWEATKRAIFSAKFLGLILLLFIVSYAIKFATAPEVEPKD